MIPTILCADEWELDDYQLDFINRVYTKNPYDGYVIDFTGYETEATFRMMPDYKYNGHLWQPVVLLHSDDCSCLLKLEND